MYILSYLKEVKAELSHVTWPTREEAQNLTLVVIGGSLAVGLYVGGLDFAFTNLLGIVLK
jgi:preprotein translocase subunit SecE